MNAPGTWRRPLMLALVCAMIGLAVVALASRARYMWSRPRCARRHNFWHYPWRTGDLVLFSTLWRAGRASLTKMLTRSPYNHVAVAYVDPRTGQPFFWEMNASGTRMATSLDLTCGRPPQNLVVRPINRPIDATAFERAVREQWECEFDFDVSLAWWHRFAPYTPFLPVPFLAGHGWGGNRQRTCAHLAAELYHALGVLDFDRTGIDPASIVPGDFGREPIDLRALPLVDGYDFGSPILLRFEQSSANVYRGPRPSFRPEAFRAARSLPRRDPERPEDAHRSADHGPERRRARVSIASPRSHAALASTRVDRAFAGSPAPTGANEPGGVRNAATEAAKR